MQNWWYKITLEKWSILKQQTETTWLTKQVYAKFSPHAHRDIQATVSWEDVFSLR